jgi:hypothetical protein
MRVRSYAREAVAVITCACLSGVAALASVSVAGGQDHVKETYYCNTLAHFFHWRKKRRERFLVSSVSLTGLGSRSPSHWSQFTGLSLVLCQLPREAKNVLAMGHTFAEHSNQPAWAKVLHARL